MKLLLLDDHVLFAKSLSVQSGIPYFPREKTVVEELTATEKHKDIICPYAFPFSSAVSD